MVIRKVDNVVEIAFDGHKCINNAPVLFQWDTGQVLKLLDVPDGAEVQFSNRNSEESINHIVVDSQVEIPDILLRENMPITAYVVIVDEEAETTTKIVTFPVKQKVKPDDIVSPDDQPSFRAEIQRIMNNTQSIAQSVRTDANEGKFDGADGDDGESAYQIAVNHGFDGTEEEWLESIANRVQETTLYRFKGSVASSNLPQNAGVGDVYCLTDSSVYGNIGTHVAWNGQAWNPIEGIFETTTDKTLTEDDVPADAKVVGDEITKLKNFKYYGKTDCIFPFKTAKRIKVVSDNSTNVTLQGVTVADFDNMGAKTYSNIEADDTYTGEGIRFRLTNLPSNINNVRLQGSVSGLVVGRTYRICVKTTDPQRSDTGHFAQIMVQSKSLKTFGNNLDKKYGIHTMTFVANSTTANIYIYPFMINGAGYTQAVGDTFIIDDFYVNQVVDDVDVKSHEDVFGATNTGTEFEYLLNNKMFVATASNESDVYISKSISEVLTVNDEEPDFFGNINVKSILKGMKCVALGDSITEKFVEYGTDYASQVAKNTGLNVFNAGVGGTTMHYRNNANWDVVCFTSIADAIASGDWSAMETLGQTPAFEKYKRVADIVTTLESINWDEVDFITLAFGANDISTDPAVSVIDNDNNKKDKSTYLGAFRYGIEKIWSKYPHIKFLVLTPIFRWWTIDGDYASSDTREFANGHLYDDWGQALIECCKTEYHVPVVDMYNTLGINTPTHLHYFDATDGTHPNQNGINLMGQKISSAIIEAY